jgi:aldose 1-epimerase
MKDFFGTLPSGEDCHLYTLRCGQLTAQVTDLGASLVRLWVPDAQGQTADVVLGYDSPEGYLQSKTYFGATVGRNANRIAGSSFVLNGKTWVLDANEGPNCLHSGPRGYNVRLWDVVSHTENRIVLHLQSPHGDQGFPGHAHIQVTYLLQNDGIRISYDAISDRDTLFNLTNHSYFNLAGHQNQAQAMDQTLMMPARFFNPDDAANIPTGELRPVAGSPMDFREPKPLGRDIGMDYEPLRLQGGYDHNFEVFCNPAAILTDPASGRSMAVYTDCPGVQLYTANFTDGRGKDGVIYSPRCGVCLETQYYPDAVHHPQWPQPFVKAGQLYHSETTYRFTW